MVTLAIVTSVSLGDPAPRARPDWPRPGSSPPACRALRGRYADTLPRRCACEPPANRLFPIPLWVGMQEDTVARPVELVANVMIKGPAPILGGRYEH
jgi:hypothetical protein